jgi:hypothetical protein
MRIGRSLTKGSREKVDIDLLGVAFGNSLVRTL